MVAEIIPFQRKQVAAHTGLKVPQVVYVVVEQSASVNTFAFKEVETVRSVHRTLEGAKKAALFWLDTKIVKMELED